jgi:CDP-diacylglycerol--serine O-phosphatidyltransferase
MEEPKPSDSAAVEIRSLDERRNTDAEDFTLPIDDHVEEVSENGRKVRRRGIFLLPNLLTTAALFSGFYAIIAGMNGDFVNAAVAIYVAGIFDGLDGRVARLTNTSSAFGVQYDSLSDMVSFGLAPALVMFSWGLEPIGKYGWAVAFAFAACTALRLARFNTQVDTADKRYFTGLASPAAAGLVAAMVWLGSSIEVSVQLSVFVGLVTLLAALLMVSNIRYYSFKGLDFRGRVPFAVILAVVLLFVVIASNPDLVLLCIAGIYATSGPTQWLWRHRQLIRKRFPGNPDR